MDGYGRDRSPQRRGRVHPTTARIAHMTHLAELDTLPTSSVRLMAALRAQSGPTTPTASGMLVLARSALPLPAAGLVDDQPLCGGCRARATPDGMPTRTAPNVMTCRWRHRPVRPVDTPEARRPPCQPCSMRHTPTHLDCRLGRSTMCPIAVASPSVTSMACQGRAARGVRRRWRRRRIRAHRTAWCFAPERTVTPTPPLPFTPGRSVRDS